MPIVIRHKISGKFLKKNMAYRNDPDKNCWTADIQEAAIYRSTSGALNSIGHSVDNLKREELWKEYHKKGYDIHGDWQIRSDDEKELLRKINKEQFSYRIWPENAEPIEFELKPLVLDTTPGHTACDWDGGPFCDKE